MPADDLAGDLPQTWRRHNTILLSLLDHVPAAGWTARPHGSKGRDVARVFFHLDRVRRGWLHYHETGTRPKLERADKGPPPPRPRVRRDLKDSGAAVERFLSRALAGAVKPRMFGRSATRWMGYLIAHESHHRGQIMLALKQSGIRMPASVALQGLWGRWISGA